MGTLRWDSGGVPSQSACKLLVCGLVALALAACASAPEPRHTRAYSAAEIAAVRLEPAAAVSALNAYRAGNGLKPVRIDPALAAMAERQAKAMAAADALSHDVAGSFSSRIAAGGIDTTEAGENIGAGYMSLGAAMEGWRRSPEHDANLKLSDATRFGIAIAKNPDGQYGVYWAMEVAAEPRPPASEVGAFLPLSGGALRTQ